MEEVLLGFDNAEKRERRCIGQTSRAELSLDGRTVQRAIDKICGNRMSLKAPSVQEEGWLEGIRSFDYCS